MKVKRNIKCIFCDFKSKDKQKIYEHIEKCHNDQIPEDISIPQYFYNMSKNVLHGNCVMCKRPTEWNEATNKYKRFCNDPKCKAKYNDIFNKRMIGKYGKVHLLNDPKVQQKMLENRKISGRYSWSDGSGDKPYTGTYEHKFLEYCDLVLDLPFDDVMTPCPFIFCYTIDGSTPTKPKYFTEEEYDCLPDTVKIDIANTYLLYRPDAYIPSINLIVEIKHGGDNPNMHTKIQTVDVVKDKAKEEVMKNQPQFNYMKITDNNYGDFLTYFANIKYFEDEVVRNRKPNVIIGENMNFINENAVGMLYVKLIMEPLTDRVILLANDNGSDSYYCYTGEMLTLDSLMYSNAPAKEFTYPLIKPIDFNSFGSNVRKCAVEFDKFIRSHITADVNLLSQSPFAFYKPGPTDPEVEETIDEVLSIIESLGGNV